MKYCSNCGKEIENFAKFCWACGNSTNDYVNTETVSPEVSDTMTPKETQNMDIYQSPTYRLGVALIIIGVIIGFTAFLFVSGKGQNFGYPDSWSYIHEGGRETGIWMVISAISSFIIGLLLKDSSISKH